MNRVLSILGAALLASAAGAEVRDETYLAGDQQIWIEYIDPIEIMWVGPNFYERTQVLSGDDIEIEVFATDELGIRLLGVPAVVTRMYATHSCETGTPLAYHVITLGPVLATDGPLTTCAELVVSVTNDMILLEADPMQQSGEDGEAWVWKPGQGFGR